MKLIFLTSGKSPCGEGYGYSFVAIYWTFISVRIVFLAWTLLWITVLYLSAIAAGLIDMKLVMDGKQILAKYHW